jgi:protein involved in polysaccharide export with SLBB domain
MDKLRKTIFILTVSCLFISGQIVGQEKREVRKVNFGYSTNPIVKTKKDKKKETNNPPAAIKGTNANSAKIEGPIPKKENLTVAKKTLEVAKKVSKATLAPTEIYQIGVGDVLFISLQNSPGSSKYYTVLNDGTIDYPLAGELVSVSGLTTDEIEEFLRDKIKLFENPDVSVKVREFNSHQISVLGLAENTGNISLQREAVPLYVIKTQAIVKPEASKVLIKRKKQKPEEYDLSETKFGESLIYPGDIIEFIGEDLEKQNNSGLFYYISGEVADVGQRDYIEGITLYQAIIASGGLKDPDIKKVIIRRKDNQGLLQTRIYKLNDIKKGKTPDPLLQVGDLIEVEN